VSGQLASGSGVDYYSFTLAAGDTAAVAVAKTSGGGETIGIYDSVGNLLSNGVAVTGGSVDQVVSNFTAASSGTYLARVFGSGSTAYNLIVTRNAAFDLGNSTSAAPQNVDAY